MIYDNLEFHNVQQLAQGEEGRLLCRTPLALDTALREATVTEYRKPAGAEIRFVAEALPVSVCLWVEGAPCPAAVYLGDHLYQSLVLSPGRQTVKIEGEDYLRDLFRTAPRGSFDCRVIRIVFHSLLSRVEYLGRRSPGRVRPPEKQELPGLRYLAYGTSITHGCNASAAGLPYCSQLARRLHADLYNMGAAGSACLEEGLGQYLAENYDFDVFTAEISVNMLIQGYTDQEFYERARAFLSPIDRLHPHALKAVISILPCFLDYGIRRPAMVSEADRYRRILRELAEELGFLFLDGPDLLRPAGLSCDLIHPGDFGMIQLAENIHKKLMAQAEAFPFLREAPSEHRLI